MSASLQWRNDSPKLTKTFHFNQAFEAGTTKRHISERGRLFGESVIVQITKVNGIEVRLSYISTLELMRGLGFATTCLLWLCDLADEHQVQIALCPCPMEELVAQPNFLQLTAWYQKHGFRRLGYGNEMIRYPRRIL